MRTLVVAAVALLGAVAGCGGAGAGVAPPGGGSTVSPDGATHLVAVVAPLEGPASSSAEAAVTAAEERFALALTAAAYRAGGADRNVLLSPFSAAADLSMLQLGSGSPTAGEIAATLQDAGVSAPDLAAGWRTLAASLQHGESSNELQLATSLWVSHRVHVEAGFLDALARGFGNETYQVDFESPTATQAINTWVREQTAAHIKQLFSPGDLPTDTEVVLADAVAFRAAWSVDSHVSDGSVETRPFSSAGGTTTSVPTVVAGDVSVEAAQGDGYEAVEIPYTNGRFAALLVEPASGTLGALVSSLTTTELAGIVRALRPAFCNLSMPVLHLSVDASLDPVLGPMGLGPIYHAANFTPMLGPAGAVNQALGTVKQAATLDVNTWGTGATAATGASIVPTLATARSILIDQPYLFLLRDTVTGVILFSSVVADPAG